jgi:hypothetical protein
MEKIKMSSARLVGHTILEAGKNCTIAKTDIVDAYKNVPAQMKDLHLQGFKWENRFFIELRQIFGARSAVQNFDVVANTVKTLAAAGCNIPARFIHRQLDDTPVVSPASKNWCNVFLEEYRSLCEHINLELAPDCPQYDKSFGPTMVGKVLGIWFNTSNLTNKSTGKSANTNRALSGVTRFVPAEEAPTTYEPTLNECTSNVQAKMPRE